MYCKNCGKELPVDSKYCPECGAKQNGNSDYNFWSKIHVPKLIKEHKKLSYAYMLWFTLHLSLFIFSDEKGKNFYPFGQELKYIFAHFPYVDFSLLEYTDSYDFSELFFYTILFPVMIYVVVRTVSFIPLYLRYLKGKIIRWRESCVSKKKYIPHKKEISNGNNPDDTAKKITNDIKNGSIDSTREKKSISKAKEVKDMPLFERFIGSMIDKILLLVIFIVVFYIISPYGAPGKLGTYCGLLGTSPNVYEYIDKAEMKRYNSGEYYESISKGFQNIERLESKPPHIGSTELLDMSITLSFILLNLIYYFLFECIFSASFGKLILKGKLLEYNNKKVIFGDILARALLGGLLMMIAVGFFHFQLGLSYYYVFFLFFFVMDIPVLFVKRSLLDICTGTKYVQRI